MMPLSKSKRYARFNVGKMMKARKEQRNKVAMAHISFQKNHRKLDSMGAEKEKALRQGILYLCSIICIRNNVRCNRKMNKRRSEALNAALRIHGGTSTNTLPAVSGLVDTLAVKGSQGN